MHGIGGKRMAEHGFVSDWPMEKLAVRGLFEVLAHYREIKGIQNALRDRLLAERPAAFIGVDTPGFNLGLEAQLKEAGIPTMHFVSPRSGPGAAAASRKSQRAVSHMLVVFPFEEAIYRSAGVPATYVGHPLAEVIPMQPDVAAAARRAGPGRNGAGRRRSCRAAACPSSSTTSGAFRRRRAGCWPRAIPACASSRRWRASASARYFESLLAEAGLPDVPLQLVDGQSHTAIAAADAVLVASGTATLEVALFKKPMVIAYKMLALPGS